MAVTNKFWFWLFVFGTILLLTGIIFLLSKRKEWWVWALLVLGGILLLLGVVIWLSEERDTEAVKKIESGIASTSQGIEGAVHDIKGQVLHNADGSSRYVVTGVPKAAATTVADYTVHPPKVTQTPRVVSAPLTRNVSVTTIPNPSS